MVDVPRCPKCKSRKFTAYVEELCTAGAPVVDGVVQSSWSVSALPERKACFGECSCGHEWRFRDSWAVQ